MKYVEFETVPELCDDCPFFSIDYDEGEYEQSYYIARTTRIFCKHQEACERVRDVLTKKASMTAGK